MSQSSWSIFLKKMGGYGAWRHDEQALAQAVQQLNAFSLDSDLSAAQIDVIMFSLSRGQALMKAVSDWEKPVVGAEPKTAQDSSHFRGAQWRLVMAYNSFEITCSALMRCKSGNVPQQLPRFIACCDLDAYEGQICSPTQPLCTESAEVIRGLKSQSLVKVQG